MNGTRVRRLAAAGAIALCASKVASAEGSKVEAPVAGPARDVTAAAQALFVDGKRLASQGRYEEAASKFEQSRRLDPAAGTQINLADCYERTGKLASAWIGFHDAVVLAERSKHPDWASQSRQRADALEPRVPKLTIVVADSPPGLEITRDDAKVPPSTYGMAVPVDPGTYGIAAAAPGYRRWASRIAIDVGKQVVLHVPTLAPEIAPVNTEPAPAAPPSPLTASSTSGPTETQGPRIAPQVLPVSAARKAAWIGSGVTAALLMGGAAALIVSQYNASIYNDDQRCVSGSLTRDERCGSYRGAASTAEDFAILQFGLAAAVAASSVVLFVATAPPTTRVQYPNLACRIGITLECATQF